MPPREVCPPFEVGFDSAGCFAAAFALALPAWLAALRWPWVAAVAVLLTVPIGMVVWWHLQVWWALRKLRAMHRRGMRGLLVYSRSPLWQSRIESEWLPRIAGRMEVLNWSDRRQWPRRDVRVQLFRIAIADGEDFNPAAIVTRDDGRPLVFRFYAAFHNAKHGNAEGLQELESQLFAVLDGRG